MEKEQYLAQQERRRQEELEQQRKEKAEYDERKRQAIIDREALDKLISSGKDIERKAKRRSASLYLLLLFAIVGGLFAYYMFLKSSTIREELRSTIVTETNQDFVEIAEMLRADIEPTTSESLEVDDNQMITSSSADMDSNNSNNGANADSTSIQSAPEIPPAQTEVADNSVAQRVDPAPNSAAYLQPLILSSSGAPQASSVAERVIIHHEAKPAEINDVIAEAYAALQANQNSEAARLYRSARAIDSDQRDALLGAAAAASALGNYDEAAQLYRRRLQSDPNDTYARAGLLSLATDANSRTSVIGEVNAMLRDYPESAQLHFLKGVRLAAAHQWQTAQSAFYQAYRRDIENADYAFNLAVTLDHLGQPSLARVYYERALDLTERRKYNFDSRAARQRLSELTAP